ncbi:Hypothetical_protein [Hexamita inflata]|uniref:Hypothetical_protein n=1 Tax=Hexamita inflata TaxID=28002 RepID=A0AA86TLK0_9EUKA|nr:Hypothetical protein HINF_LOCUS8611 [Hexamita inflata]
MCTYAKSANIRRVPGPAPQSIELLSVGRDPEIRSAGDADFPMILRVFSQKCDQEGSGPGFRQENESPNLESRVSLCLQQENSENGIDQFILARKYFQAESNVRWSR